MNCDTIIAFYKSVPLTGFYAIYQLCYYVKRCEIKTDKYIRKKLFYKEWSKMNKSLHIRLNEGMYVTLMKIFHNHRSASVRNISEYVRAILQNHIEAQYQHRANYMRGNI